MAVVKLEGITKVYEGSKESAVKDINFQVDDGEFMVLLGPSGCGKSTILRMIAGLENISGGRLSIDGKMINDIPAKDRDIAMVFQSYALYPHMKVRDNLAFGLRRRGIPKAQIKHRVNQVAESLGLTPFLNRRPHALSGGQRQRVAVGRAIVRDPKVFLFDEPLSNLDASLRVSTRNELVSLHDRLGATTIYVTHDQVEAMTMGTKIVIMKDGVVNQVGTPMEIYDFPVNKFVAGFIGNPGMNFLPARIAPKDSTLYVDAGSFQLLIPPEKHSYLQSKAEREVILGIRPEHLQDVAFPDDSKITDSFKAVVEVVETLGAEVQLDVVCGEHNLVARVDPRTTAKRHQERELAVNMDKIHIFETEPPNQRVKTEER